MANVTELTVFRKDSQSTQGPKVFWVFFLADIHGFPTLSSWCLANRILRYSTDPRLGSSVQVAAGTLEATRATRPQRCILPEKKTKHLRSGAWNVNYVRFKGCNMNVEGKEPCKCYVVHCSSQLGEFHSWFRTDGRHFTSLKGTQTPSFMARWSPTKTAQVCMREWTHVGVVHAFLAILSAERAANSTLVSMNLQICSAFLEMLNLSRLALANPRMTHDEMCSCWRFFYVEIQRLSSSSVRGDTFLYNAGISLLDSRLKYIDL